MTFSAKTKMKFIESFPPPDLAAIRAGIREVARGKIQYDHPTYFGQGLREVWDFDYPVVSYNKLPSMEPPMPAPLPPMRPSRESMQPCMEPPETIMLPSREPSKWYIGMTKQFKKDITNIDRKLQGRILQSISNILDEPTTVKGDTVKPLTSDLKGLWRYRIGDFRLIYTPNPEKSQVTLVSFASRGEAY